MEKQEAEQDRKEKRKVTALPLSTGWWKSSQLFFVFKRAVTDSIFNWKVQARLSEIQEALKETKAVQEMKEQVLLLIYLLQTLFISF